jgi:hypothetical protein
VKAYETQARKPAARPGVFVWRCHRCGRVLMMFQGGIDGVLVVHHHCGAVNRLDGRFCGHPALDGEGKDD